MGLIAITIANASLMTGKVAVTVNEAENKGRIRVTEENGKNPTTRIRSGIGRKEGNRRSTPHMSALLPRRQDLLVAGLARQPRKCQILFPRRGGNIPRARYAENSTKGNAGMQTRRKEKRTHKRSRRTAFAAIATEARETHARVVAAAAKAAVDLTRGTVKKKTKVRPCVKRRDLSRRVKRTTSLTCVCVNLVFLNTH